MANIHIAVVNAGTSLKDKEIASAVPAFQTQVRRDFAPVWGIDADVSFTAKGSRPPSGAWWLAVLDDSDQAGALGYHDITDQGLPLGKVFAASDKKYGLTWTVTASHELLEMLGDPDINLAAYVEHGGGGLRLYAYEVCDACEADKFGYAIDGVLVSDFVTPAWFESFRKTGSARFDHQGRIKHPFQLLPGGYIGVYDAKTGSGWTQLTAEGHAADYAMRPRVGSRRERRKTPREQWMKSRVKW